MINFLLQHQFWDAVVLYWIFSAAISALPEPKPNDSPGYLWLYRFLHTTAGNITTAFSRLPGFKPFILLLLVPLVFSTAACGAHYRIHPGAVNATDSAAYDTLLTAEAAIKQARVDGRVGDRLDSAVRFYNAARGSWLTYRGAAGRFLKTKHLGLGTTPPSLRSGTPPNLGGELGTLDLTNNRARRVFVAQIRL